MAGLCAAARARELGASPTVFEKGTRPGGSMLLSSGVIWRYRSFEEFRAQCPDGDERLQRLVFERLDEGLEWLESLGAPVVTRETENPLTTGVRFDTEGLTEALFRAAGEVRSRTTGRRSPGIRSCWRPAAFKAIRELVERYVRPAAPLRVRANPWSAGDGLRVGLDARRSPEQRPGRVLRPQHGRRRLRRGRLRARSRRSTGATPGSSTSAGRSSSTTSGSAGRSSTSSRRPPTSRARGPGTCSTTQALDQQVRYGTVRELVASAPTRTDPAELPFEPPPGTVAAVRVAAAITHTIGGLRVDERARVLDEHDEPIDGLFAAGVDAGGISTGGYASGLASALVLGRTAAETALS